MLNFFLYPHPLIRILLTVLSASGLLYVFYNGLDARPVAYVIYLLSFYTLCIIVVSVPPLIQRIRTRIYDNRHAARYLGEAALRARLSLYSGTILNLAYAIFKLITGIVFQSVWFGAVAVYYMVLSLIRFFLIRKDRKNARMETPDKRRLHGLKSYAVCGLLLLALNGAMSGMVFQMVWQNQGYSYPGFVIYASAAYTFYRLTMSIVKTAKMRKSNNPVLAAAKAIDLSVALMAIFALQTAMFASFGTDMEPATRQLMNALTGGSVCFFVVCIAIFMIVKATKEIKNGGFKRGKQ